MPTSNDLLTLSRSDLYELVWSKPMTELAKDFGLSDVALAKRCRRLGVPVPGRGYWARVAAGQAPHRPKLSKRATTDADEGALTFDVPQEEQRPPAPESNKVAEFQQVLQTLQVTGSEDLRSASPPVKRTAVHLKRPWRAEIQWHRGERKGPIVELDVGEGTVDRALSIAERLISAAASIGWEFKEPPEAEDGASRDYAAAHLGRSPRFGYLEVDGEPLAIRIHERRRRTEHVLTEAEKASKRKGHYIHPPRWDYTPSGELRLTATRAETRYSARTWKDTKRRPLEDQLNTILSDFLSEALQIKEDREERRLADIERRREERLRWEQSERRSANAELIHEIEAQAGAWLRARFLRSYLRALRRALGPQQLEARLQGETVNFLDWADHYVDQLDPLCLTPHDADLKTERSSYYSPIDTRVAETLNRLLGNCWEDAFEITDTAPEEPNGNE